MNSPQHKKNFDNKVNITRSIDISKIEFNSNNDKDKARFRGTIMILLVRLRGTHFDLKDKKIGNPWELLTFFQFVYFSKNDYFVAIDEHEHKETS